MLEQLLGENVNDKLLNFQIFNPPHKTLPDSQKGNFRAKPQSHTAFKILYRKVRRNIHSGR